MLTWIHTHIHTHMFIYLVIYLMWLFFQCYSYEHSTGREAVLEMLHAIMMKFPKNFLDKHAQQLYIHLVQCLANDSDHQVRSMAGAVIKQLHGRTSPHVNDSIFFDFTLSWYMGEKRQLQSVGAQASDMKLMHSLIVCSMPYSDVYV